MRVCYWGELQGIDAFISQNILDLSWPTLQVMEFIVSLHRLGFHYERDGLLFGWIKLYQPVMLMKTVKVSLKWSSVVNVMNFAIHQTVITFVLLIRLYWGDHWWTPRITGGRGECWCLKPLTSLMEDKGHHTLVDVMLNVYDDCDGRWAFFYCLWLGPTVLLIH